MIIQHGTGFLPLQESITVVINSNRDFHPKIDEKIAHGIAVPIVPITSIVSPDLPTAIVPILLPLPNAPIFDKSKLVSDPGQIGASLSFVVVAHPPHSGTATTSGDPETNGSIIFFFLRKRNTTKNAKHASRNKRIVLLFFIFSYFIFLYLFYIFFLYIL